MPKNMRIGRVIPALVTTFYLLANQTLGEDVIVYLVGKSKIYAQDSAAAPILIPGAWDGFARVYLSAPGSVLSAQVGPSGNPNLDLDPIANVAVPQLNYGDGPYNTKAVLDGAVPNGIYTMRMVTLNDGTINADVDVSPDSYPRAPRVLNFPALQMVNPAAPQEVQWVDFTPSDGNDAILVSIFDEAASAEILQTPLPNQPGVLGAAATGYTIPANTLEPNKTYTVRIDFIKVVNQTIGPYPNVPGLGVFVTRNAARLRTGAAIPPPNITQQPANAIAPLERRARFSVVAVGPGPLRFQWRRDNLDIPGATNSTLIIPNAQFAQSGTYTVVVGNSGGSVTSFGATLTVLSPPVIVTHPQSQTVDPTNTVIFTVLATNVPAPFYQWHANGQRIPGATNATLVLTNVQPDDGGTYYAVAVNGGGAVNSSNAVLVVRSPPLGLSDNLADRPHVGTFSGIGSGSNVGATSEPGEPNHAGKVGGRSVWFGWTSPDDGVVTFLTRGSSFDTLLAAYTGTSIADLVPIFGDDDGGGRLTSKVQFNATHGVEYLIAIDGRAGATGAVVLSWNFVPGPRDFPRIVQQPLNITAPVGSKAMFSVGVEGTDLEFQWLFNGTELPGETATNLTIANVQTDRAGIYRVRITSPNRVTVSEPAALEIISQPTTPTQDKFEDALELAPLRAALGVRGTLKLVSPAAGVIGSQLLNNYGATLEPGEPAHGGVAGGASRWQVVVPEADGILQLDTEGSGPDSVLAVYTGTSLETLKLVAQDNNSGPDGRSAFVRFPVTAGTLYHVAIDTVGGVEGLLQLNWRLGLLPTVTLPPLQLFTSGESLVLNATVSGGTGPYTYQWNKDSEIIPGANESTIELDDLQDDDTGFYTLSVSNSAGEVTRTVHLAQIGPSPLVLSDPQGGISAQGTNVALTVTAAATLPVRYQWLYKGKAIRGATNANYALVRPTTRQSGDYRCVVSTSAGAVTSAVAAVNVLLPVQIKSPPKTVVGQPGKKATFTVKAVGSAPLQYQWQFNGVNVPGGNAAGYSIAAVQAANIGEYRAMVGNALGSTMSAPVTLAAVLIKTQPKNLSVAAGAKAVLSVKAQGAPPLRYQWQLNGSDVAGATDSSLTVFSAQTTNAGTYSVVVSNALGSATSSNAILTVSSAASALAQQLPANGLELDLVGSSPKLIATSQLHITLRPDGAVQVDIVGTPGSRHVIEVSADLTNWTPVETVVNTTGAVQWLEGDVAGQSRRFYRVRETR